MGGFDEHRNEALQRYPALSLAIALALFVATRDTVLVLLTLACGSRVITASSALPDVDSHRSKPRQDVGRLITWAIAGFAALSALRLLDPGPGLTALFRRLPTATVAAALLLLLLVWVGMSSRHRSLTHSIAWTLAVAAAVGTLGFSLLRYGGVAPAFGFGGSLATYSFIGLYSHIDLDGERSLLWEPDERSFTDYRAYLGGMHEQYAKASVVAVAAGVVLLDASVLLLLLLVAGYGALLAGRTLPAIERKRSRPRLAFDRVVSVLLGGVLLQQLLVGGLLPAVGGAAFALPVGSVPAFLLALFVLWLGRNAEQGSLTHSLVWPAAVTASVSLCCYALAGGLAVTESVALSAGVGGYLLVGFLHHLRVDGVVDVRRRDDGAVTLTVE